MKRLVCATLVGLLCGCTTVGQVNKNYSQVDYKDGINEKEAVFIAQSYCLKDEECKGKVRISMPEIRYNDAGWEVTFASKDLTALDYTFLVNVNEKTGSAAPVDVHRNF